MDGRVERDPTPIVVVRVASDGFDVGGEVCRPVRETFGGLIYLTPMIDNPVELVREEGGEGSQGNRQGLYDTKQHERGCEEEENATKESWSSTCVVFVACGKRLSINPPLIV